MTGPLVSIIMPVYNSGKYVEEAILSVFAQDYINWQLIIINDGSKDESAQVIDRFKDPRIIKIDQANAGVSAARNTGLQRMTGDYFCFLDADDALPPASLADRLAVFQTSNEIAFVDGVVEVYDDSMKTVIDVWRPAFRGRPFAELVGLTGRCFFGMTWMFRRDNAVVYKFRESMTHGEDLLFYIDYSHAGIYASAHSCTFWYRRNSQSAMSNLTALGRGYRELGSYIFEKFKVSKFQQLKFWLKTRRIMFLSFFNNDQYWKGIRYLILGH